MAQKTENFKIKADLKSETEGLFKHPNLELGIHTKRSHYLHVRAVIAIKCVCVRTLSSSSISEIFLSRALLS